MEPFKNLYNKKSLQEMAEHLERVSSKFPKKRFLSQSLKGLKHLEMKERVVHIAQALEDGLSGPYDKNVALLLKTIRADGQGLEGFLLWPYTYYIETRGLEHFDISMDALYEITQRYTGEFGVRPFFEHYPEKVYKIFTKWSKDRSEHVRRWVSEGTRPNLPWGQKISHLEGHLGRNIKLLEALKEDPSLYVRKSVANHMNDISWYDDALVIKTLKTWKKIKTKEMEWIIRQSLRSLLKQGHPQALALLGFDSKKKSLVKNLKLSRKRLKEGESFDVTFTLKSQESKTCQFMVDYIVYYPKANGRVSPKTFKLKSLGLEPRGEGDLRKTVRFKKVTTRRHYPGKHRLAIQVNGIIKADTSFVLN